MTSKPEILHMESCVWALGELCWITQNTFARKRLLKALGHRLKLLHSNTGNQFCVLCTRQLRKSKICIFQALLTIPNKPQNKSGGKRLNAPPTAPPLVLVFSAGALGQLVNSVCACDQQRTTVHPPGDTLPGAGRSHGKLVETNDFNHRPNKQLAKRF